MCPLTVDLRSDESAYHTTFQDVEAKGSFFQSFLFADAITSLIERADTEDWEHHSGELRPEAFYDAVLSAIARHYARDTGLLPDTVDPHGVLALLIDKLTQHGYLSKKLKEEQPEAFYEETWTS